MAVARVDGAALRRARESAGLSLDELARKVGVANGYRVAIWESGAEQPKPRMVPLLAQALHVTPLELVECDPDDPSLSALRLSRGLAREEVQAGVFLAKMTYNRLEGGVGVRPPSAGVVEAVADFLQVPQPVARAAIARSRADLAET